MCTREVTNMTIQELEQCILLYGKDIYSFCMHLAKEKESADDKVAEKYFTQIEEQKDDENAAAQKETDEMAGNEQIEKRLDGAKLIESETKTVTPDEDGTFTYQAYRPAKA